VIKRLRAFSKRIALSLNLIAVVGILLAYLATQVSPENFPLLALFGIAYGIFLVLNILFVIFWLLVKKRLALISSIAILIGYSYLASYIQLIPEITATDPPAQSITIVSQNVKLFGWYNWTENIQLRDQMIRSLEKSGGDIFCFQEYFHNSTPGIFETRETIKLALGAPHVFDQYTSHIHNGQQYGIATFSKHPIVSSGKIEFKGEKNNNICIYTDVIVYGDTMRIYNVHAASIRFSDSDYDFIEKINEEKQEADVKIDQAYGIVERLSNAFQRRARQVSLVKEHANKSPYPTIICGDFNDTPVSYSYATISKGLVDTFRKSGGIGIGSTYLGAFPSFRIDYIFHSADLESSNYMRYEGSVSDHTAISAVVWKD
jgi:endonuclease/exonuclease/phosphatase family metal-dependent hydrolase